MSLPVIPDPYSSESAPTAEQPAPTTTTPNTSEPKKPSASPPSPSPSLYEKGIATRRAVLGDAYVSASLSKGTTSYWSPASQLINEVAWGNIWNRPGLERRDRSLINIAFLTALKMYPELAIHTKGAMRNGVTEEEIRETVLQGFIYCGFPAGIEAMKVTEKAVEETKHEMEEQRKKDARGKGRT